MKKQNPSLSEQIARCAGVSPLVGQLLAGRGIKTGEEAVKFLSAEFGELPNPFQMAGMTAAVKRMEKAVTSGETVAIYGDYDADGVTATALLCGFLRSIETDAIYFAPHRVRDGYGINLRAVEELKSRGATLTVSADCGITAAREVEEAKQLGMDFIITDHHLPDENLPRAAAVINPKAQGCGYPGKEIAGVGVAFNLALALRARLRESGFFDRRPEPNMAQYLDLVAIGTVADRAPLVNVNRIMVREGMKRMSAARRPGVAALKKVSGINGEVTSGDISYKIAPRINAAGRIAGPETAVELLLTESDEQAAEIARNLNRQNFERRRLEQKALGEALSMIENSPEISGGHCIVAASAGWHPGIIGPLASKITERYSKPAFAISIGDSGSGKGSGRSTAGINLHEAIRNCGQWLEQYGGHAMAAGITILESKIEGFRKAMSDHIKTLDAAGSGAQKTCLIDARIEAEELTPEIAEQIAVLEPFGSGNPRPLLLIEGAQIVSHSVIKNSHVKFFIKTEEGRPPLEAMWWNAADEIKDAHIGTKAAVVFTPEFNTWGGRKTLTLRTVDICPDA